MVRPIRHAYLCAGGLLFGTLLAPAVRGEDETAVSPIVAAAVVATSTDDDSSSKADDVSRYACNAPASTGLTMCRSPPSFARFLSSS